MMKAVRSPRLVGRTEELNFLRKRCGEARSGRGSLVFIYGEAGIGKSRLVDEVIAGVRPPAMQHAKGFCFEHARSPLGPLTDIVRTLHAADDSILAVARSVRRVLSRLVPELLETDDAPNREAQGARSQYAAIGEMLRRFGALHPSVIVVEDAHWADVSTTEFIKYFADKVADTHLLVIVVMRADAVNGVLFSPIIAELRRQGAVAALDIEPLSAVEMQTLIRSAAGAHRLAHADLRHVAALADGNPLFAEELVASAIARGTGPRGLPPTIRDIFGERMSGLQPDDREILVEASVLGRRFDPSFLAHLTGRPLERVLLALRRARTSNLIAEDDSGVVFRTALIRETLYETILQAEARRIHRRIVDELERLPQPDRKMSELAYHAWAAGEVHAASRYNELAGDEAMALLATDEAAVFYGRALSCMSREAAGRAALERKRGVAYSESGCSGRAIEMLEQAYVHAREQHDAEAMAGIASDIAREHVLGANGDAAVCWGAASLAAAETLRGTSACFRAMAEQARAHAWRGDTRRAAELIARAEACAGPRDEFDVQSLHDARAAVHFFAGRRDDALAHYRGAVKDAKVSGNTALLVRSLLNYADMARIVGEIEAARDAAAESVRMADAIIVPHYRPYVLVDSGLFDAHAGLLETARRRLSQAEEAAAGLDAPRVHAHLVQLGLVLSKALDDRVLDERYSDERAIEDAFSSREPWWIGSIANVFAFRYVRIGRSSDARELVGRAVSALPTLLRSHEFAITVAALGRVEDIAFARAELVRWSNIATREYGSAFVELFEAQVARREGAPHSDLARGSARRFDALGLPLWAAEAYEVAGERASALEIYLRIGSKGDIARLTTTRTIDLEKAQLTRREREVLIYVSEGRSNRSIADALSLSERTVESHIRAILAKTGGRSRQDIIDMADIRALR
jgi:DNA-binding CsgD family transcriptional regulator/tetratricopeptide (TPR) repeat protein